MDMIQWMRPHRTRRLAPGRTALWALALLLVDGSPATAQTPFDLYRERTAMLATGERCRLFDGPTGAALAAGQSQARSAALRAGADAQTLEQGADQARRQVAGLACTAPIVQREAQRVRAAFSLYVGLHRMSFPGSVAAWRADRTLAINTTTWRLAQDAFAGQDKVVFGLAGREGEQAMTVAVSDPDGEQPYAARLVMRDPERAQAFIPDGHSPLSARAPLRASAKIVMAEARAPADRTLLPMGARTAAAFRFPSETLDALQQLDPREAISVELLYPSAGGDRVRTAFLEVGDFNAGLAFLRMGPR